MKDSFIARGTLIRLVHDKYNVRITADAADSIIENVNDYCDGLILKASDLADHAKRMTINPSDVKLSSSLE